MIEWLIFFSVCGLYLFLIAPSFEVRTFPQQKFAHRGFHTKDKSIKENSLAAFQVAVAKGYGIELDVQLTKDHQVVVYHDSSLRRLEKDPRLIAECTYAELQPFQIPLLSEVLTMVDGQVALIVELKTVPFTKITPFCSLVARILKKYEGDYCIESFHPLIVAWFKKNAPQVMRGQLIQPIKAYPNFLQGIFLNSYLYQWLSRPHFIAYKAKYANWNLAFWLNRLMGVKLAGWTIRSPQELTTKKLDAIIFEYFEA